MVDDLKGRILDAAVDCFLESHPGARIHAAIAERAKVSRPTVYKYVGDQDAIVMALIERDISRMHAAIEPIVTRPGTLRQRFVDTIVAVVEYARNHALLQKVLRENPISVLPWFTVHSEQVIQTGLALFTPHVKQAIADGEFPTVDPIVIVEWCCRLILSLITTPGTVRIDDSAALRRYLEDLLDVGLPR
ncbi:TetR/AcrR family transcriptional regulator [Kibdelosporangium aridum]|uniref:TetR/AcrR family transcriptional regulator n=1 Tax=Kibdelosporangium aridum TaxID=2030 RepID=A0A428Z475_KIBAR|nr:TetR/AcrR family transcriptional regulator [Kibdelosporangium aridum]RSM81224.1 TetR/AcrR family transcriptional regulator [Kibdelosporangium aridum]